MLNIKNLKRLLTENQILVILIGIILGLVFPSQLTVLNTYSTQLLILVFFFSSLRLSLGEVVSYARDWRMLVITTLYMLVIMPFALFIPTSFLSQEWSVALLILGAMPTGMTIALMAEFFGGKTSLALVITTVTSLLAPFTIPLVTKIAIGQSVEIDTLGMFWSLSLTIVAPFVLAMLVKRAVPKQVEKLDGLWRNLSVAAFGVLITGIVASTQGGGGITFTMRDAWMMVISMVLLGAMTWGGYYIVQWRSSADRMTIALCMLYMNNTLALFVGERFFRDLGVVPKQVLLLLVVNALLPVLKLATIRVLGTKRA
ncbi:bile acid:sodium symporter [Candidatus Uhrbacteria bacterium]|nr:MAG: bile acid:sodium symporter [Candidatus Uhrbacteria bacterium]